MAIARTPAALDTDPITTRLHHTPGVTWSYGGMTSSKLTVLPALAIALVSFTASADGPTYQPTLKYRWAGLLELFASPAEACKAGVKELGSKGNKQTYVGTKPGSDTLSIICVLRDSDNKIWDQPSITIVPKCLDGSDSKSKDNSGTLASQVCPCDPAGCPEPPKPTGPTVNPDAKPKRCPGPPNPSCKAKQAPPGVERSARCTQQPARKVTKAEAERQSTLNQLQLTNTSTGKRIVADYDKALRAIRKDIADGKSIKTGRDQAGKEFPKFGPRDMCVTKGPTDVNIGMLCGSREADFAAANNMAGLAETPEFDGSDQIDCVWHHHEDLGRMQLIKKSAHRAKPHTGGVKVWEDAMGIKDYPLCCP